MNDLDTISTYEYSREKLARGVGKLAAIIKPTYGPAGGNVILQDNMPPGHRVTNDGKLIADMVILGDPIENIGANVLKEAADKAQQESGDGRKTTIILADALIQEGMKVKDITPMALKREMDACLPVILDSLAKATNQIGPEDVAKVATIACEDEAIGTMIGAIYQEIGKDGVIEVDTSGLAETIYEVQDGVRFRHCGYLGDYSCTTPGKAIYKNPHIFISKDKITSINQLENVLKPIASRKINELVIFCEDIDMQVASKLAFSHVQGVFKTLIIKAPSLFKNWIFEDLVAITGATPVDSKEGHTFKNFTFDQLGTCDTIITSKDETRIIGIKDTEKLQGHIKDIEEQKHDNYKVRLSWLQTKVATLKVGAQSESELSYKLKKTTDGCSAAYWALQKGVVKGGGISLTDAIDILPTTVVGAIIAKALMVPSMQIIENGCETAEGVSDPAVVVENAVKNAVSIAGIILTAKGVIPLKQHEAQVR